MNTQDIVEKMYDLVICSQLDKRDTLTAMDQVFNKAIARYKADADRLAGALKCQIETADMDERTRNYALSQARAALAAHERG